MQKNQKLTHKQPPAEVDKFLENVMCEYCEGKETVVIASIDGDFEIYNLIYIENGVIFSNIKAFGDDVECSAKIHYCPMCGKKLEQQNEQV